ncbi:hypothetical protein Tco_0627050 [Tanacetum coccineum]|uniref:Uncharacterized protein n=1 Tax=Tanacetum coccineum TaxID=301880 RepID=A0ABQ4WLG1_9ASTR
MEKEHKQSVYFGKEDDKRRGVDYVMKMIFGFYKECLELEPKYKINNDEGGSASKEGFTNLAGIIREYLKERNSYPKDPQKARNSHQSTADTG